MDEQAKEFGAYLRSLRKSKGLTLTQLGDLINLSNPYLSQIENGQKGIPSPDILRKLAEPLGVSHAELMVEAGHFTFVDWLSVKEEEGDNKTLIDAYTNMLAENERRLKKLELSNFLQQPGITYNRHELTDQDRKLIKVYLDTLFADRDEPS